MSDNTARVLGVALFVALIVGILATFATCTMRVADNNRSLGHCVQANGQPMECGKP